MFQESRNKVKSNEDFMRRRPFYRKYCIYLIETLAYSKKETYDLNDEDEVIYKLNISWI